MDYYVFNIIPKELHESEMLMAFLSELPFDTFQENQTGFDAYIPAVALDDEETVAAIEQLSTNFGFHYEKKFLPTQNWNELWESNFSPISVEDFCGVRASFHKPLLGVQHEIIISPEMAFGTGHHETTYMMMAAMQHLAFEGKRVFDFGCGTGILAMLASKLGATTTLALDHEFPAYENTLLTATLNNINNIEARFGTLDDVSESSFDIVLANINRNVILDSLTTLYEKINPSGFLLVSGFLAEDEPLLRQAAEGKFEPLRLQQKGKWICELFQKNA